MRCVLCCAGRALPAALILCAAAARAGDLADPSPLGLRTQGTLRELFLDATLSDARRVERPFLDVRYAIANDWGMPSVYTQHGTTVIQELDEQSDGISVVAGAPLSRLFPRGPALFDRISAQVELRAQLHWGGWSDGPIESWHDLTGAFNFNRAQYPRDQLHIALRQIDGPTAFDVSGTTLAIDDPILRVACVLAEGGFSRGPLGRDGTLRRAWAVSVEASLKAPLGSLSSLGGSGGFDGGLALLGTYEVAQWLTAHGMVAVTGWSNWSSDIALRPKPWHLTGEVSLVFTLGSFALLLEDRAVSPLLMPGWQREEAGGNDGFLASTLAGSFRTHNQVSWGLRYAGFSLWLSEDFTPGDNSRSTMKWLYNSNAPDVVVGLAYRRAFQ